MRESVALKIRAHIETAVQSLDRTAALEVITLHPVWVPGKEYEPGLRLQRNGKLYEVKEGKAHTSQADWPPEITPSLYEVVNETHAGTLGDPIPYDGNMALVSGLYYTQGGKVYRCTRDTVNPVYNPLADLVGLYVEEVSVA